MINVNYNENSKIYGVGFSEERAFCYKKELLKGLQKEFTNLEIVNHFPEDADVIILNLDKAALPLLESQLPNDHCFVILIAHEITRVLMPYFKLADHVIFINELQNFVCTEYVDVEIPSSSILPYPFAEEHEKEHNYDNVITYIEGDNFEEEKRYYMSRAEQMLTFFPMENIKKYYFLCEVPDGQEKKFKAVEKILKKKVDERFILLNANKLTYQETMDIIKTCPHGQLFTQEQTIKEYLKDIEDGSHSPMFTSLKESPILAAMLQLCVRTAPLHGKSYYNYNNVEESTWEEWVEDVQEVLENLYTKTTQEKIDRKAAIEVDTIESLNIVKGAPLSNDFIFSICFRNQEEKIIRCIDSLVNQTGGHDFGLAFVSDVSTDGSVQTIIDHMKGKNIDYVLVDNKDRKLASRNFYNVAHLLTTNDDSVIIEVDGDDFLATDEALSILKSYYDQGALKTNGSYKMYPEEQTFTGQEDLERNHRRFDVTKPWHLEQCTAWLHLRTSKRGLIRKVEIDHFLEKRSKKWLLERHDSAVHPRLIELAGDKAIFVEEILYCYDVSGDDHDHDGENKAKEVIASYTKYDKIYHPISYC